MFFYYNKTQANNGRLVVLYVSDTKLTEEKIQHINEYQDNLLIDYILYESETAFEGYPIVEGGTLRQATDRELVEKGIRVLNVGEKLVGDDIVVIDKPKEHSYAYDWNGDEWVLDVVKLPEGIKYNGLGFEVVSIPEGYLRYHWEYPDWIDDTTDVDRVEKSLNEYLQLNNYLDGEEMKEKGIFEDYKSYINELKIFIKSHRGAVLDLGLHDKFTVIPQPSVALMNFYNSKVEE